MKVELARKNLKTFREIANGGCFRYPDVEDSVFLKGTNGVHSFSISLATGWVEVWNNHNAEVIPVDVIAKVEEN